MPLCAVLDTTVLVSAFLTPGGATDALVDHAKAGRITCAVAEDILAETARVLLTTDRIRQRYPYTDADVQDYLQGLRQAVLIVSDLPALSGIVRDPNDDMILACAVAASASHVVTHDDDLLSLGTHESITIVTPEVFLTMLRSPDDSVG
jgi:putative PIN family toxin of toxin-antitoxin system